MVVQCSPSRVVMYWWLSLLAITGLFSPHPQTSLLLQYITIRSQLSQKLTFLGGKEIPGVFTNCHKLYSCNLNIFNYLLLVRYCLLFTPGQTKTDSAIKSHCSLLLPAQAKPRQELMQEPPQIANKTVASYS